MRQYNKQSLDSKALLEEFKIYGLVVDNEQESITHIQNVGAHRLSQYFSPFYTQKRRFKENTNFTDIIHLYMMDRELRFLCLDAIERIEVAFRSILFNTMCERYSPHWYTERTIFKTHFNHNMFINDLKNMISFSDKTKQCDEVREYYNNYDSPNMPTSWVVAEKIPFGNLLYIYSSLNDNNDKQAVAMKLGFRAKYFISYLRYIKHFRNKCAHHERIWDTSHHIDMPTIEKRLQSSIPPNNTKCYTNLALLHLIRKSITSNKSFQIKLKRILKDSPLPYNAPMGFPHDWETLPFWDA